MILGCKSKDFSYFNKASTLNKNKAHLIASGLVEINNIKEGIME
jgi:hypothetical protein